MSHQPSKIIGIYFSMLSPDEIRNNSVVEVVSRETYTNNKPVIGGLFDPKMGVLEKGSTCPTDGLTYIHTPGYFGHIELARPVLFIQLNNTRRTRTIPSSDPSLPKYNTLLSLCSTYVAANAMKFDQITIKKSAPNSSNKQLKVRKSTMAALKTSLK